MLDELVVLYPEGTSPQLTVQDDGEDALVLLDGEVVARVTGAAGLAAGAVQLRPE